MKFQRIKTWRLYVITDRNISGRSYPEAARVAIEGGADVIQLRDKDASSSDLYRSAREIRRMTREAGVDFIVNDRLDIAQAVEADGVHLGQDDLPVRVAREILGSEMIIGGSVRFPDEAVQMEKDGADYLGIGPVFEARSTKPDTIAPQGLELIRDVKQKAALPVVAIGGIGFDNVGDIFHAGAECAAVISAIMGADDITEATRRMKTRIRSQREEG